MSDTEKKMALDSELARLRKEEFLDDEGNYSMEKENEHLYKTILEITQLAAEYKRDYEKANNTNKLATHFLNTLDIYTWDTELRYSTPPSDDTKEMLMDMIALGYSITRMEEEIKQNSAANDYWKKMLMCLKLGDENGRFKF